MRIRLRHAGILLGAALIAALGCPHAGPATAQSAAPTPVGAAVAAAGCRRDAFRVAVDVGHTVDVPGAISARGIPEYAFNLQLGRDVREALIAAGFTQTALIVTELAPWQGLVQRANIANAARADVFISLHHDSVPDNLLQAWQYDGQDNRFNDDYPGYALFISNDNAERRGSLAFAALLGAELQRRGLQYTKHYTLPLMGHRRRELLDAKAGVYRYDQLLVLRLTRMPAVLLEAGSIVNRPEELQLGTPERRALTSGAIVAAVEEFCAARAPRSPTTPGRSAGGAAKGPR